MSFSSDIALLWKKRLQRFLHPSRWQEGCGPGRSDRYHGAHREHFVDCFRQFGIEPVILTGTLLTVS